MSSHTWVFGIYARDETALQAAGELRLAGFRDADISIRKTEESDGLTGALLAAGVPEHHAKRCSSRVSDGGAVVFIHCDNAYWASSAKEVLGRTGPDEIASASGGKS